MPAQWTGDILSKMHINRITSKQLADAVGWNRKYLSAVLNGHKEPKMAEKKLNDALDRIIEKRKEASDGEERRSG